VADLDAQVAQQETEANEAIASLEDKWKELESELDIVAGELKEANQQLQAQMSNAAKLEEQVAKLSENFMEQWSTIQNLEAERKSTEEQLCSVQEKLSSMEIKCEELQPKVQPDLSSRQFQRNWSR